MYTILHGINDMHVQWVGAAADGIVFYSFNTESVYTLSLETRWDTK